MSEIIVEINGGTNDEFSASDTYTYKYYKYKYHQHVLTFVCQPQYCSIQYQDSTSDLTFDDVLFANATDHSTPNVNPLFRDAMRKLNILHIIKYDCTLEIKKIKITIDDNRSKTYDKSSHLRFPFYYTGIPKGPLGLYRLQKLEGLPSSPWNNPDIIRMILNTSQTKAEKNFLFIAMYSYLAGKNQEHEYNKFVYYWSAINAMGQYLPQIYDFFQDTDSTKWEANFEKLPQRPNGDSVVLRALSYIINKDDETFSGRNISKYIDSMEDESDQLLRYKIKNIDKDCDSLSELYQTSYKYETSDSTADSEYDATYQKLLQYIDTQIKQKENIFTFFLLWYPYYWRNRFIHANRTIPVFYTYSDVEMIVLKTINYFMENYIGTTLPHWFILDSAMSTSNSSEIPEEITEELRSIQKALEKTIDYYRNNNQNKDKK